MIKQLKFSLKKELPVILQSENAECGLACLAMVASFHGYNIQLAEIRGKFPISAKGTTLDQLAGIAEKIGLHIRGLRVDLADLAQLQLPAMLHWNLNHFVVLKEVRSKVVVLHDPAIGCVTIPIEEVSSHFTGVVAAFRPSMKFVRKASTPPLQVSQLVGKVVGLKRSLIQLLMLAVVLEGLSILLPIFNEWIMDGAIVSGDRNLLTLLGCGMVGLGLTQATIGAFRSWIGLYISTTFNVQWMSNVMSHLMRLPIEYFERRHIGDIVSKFGTINSIQRTLTSSAVEATLDGILAVGTIAMMLLYSVKLSAITIAAVVLYAFWRWIRFHSIRIAQVNFLAKQAKEQTYFLETIRGVRSIKLFNRERARGNNWLNLWIDSTNASLATQKLNLMYGVSWSYLSTLERVFVLWSGASSVMSHSMSLGMFFAFLSYKEQFTGRVNTLIDRLVDFKMLSVQTERLADIVLAAPEENFAQKKYGVPENAQLAFHNVDYGYPGETKLILDKASLQIAPGDCIAIIGPSGCGKTTCLKLMLGILKPKSGEMKIAGLKLRQIGLEQYREISAAVMQDDRLFAGSIYDNICFMTDKPDEERVTRSAKLAHIHDEIMAMSMGYHTLIGDMGAAISGGQQQRILLARALYREPQILFLDEATSHLDIVNEAKIVEAIADLKMTRVLIAHRPQTIAIANRILKIENGKFVEVQKSQLDSYEDMVAA